MTTTSSSARSRRTTLLAVACGAMFLGGSSVAAPKLPKSNSFFDAFNGIDGQRWMVSDGWVNGAQQGCTWSRETMVAGGGVLHLRVAKSTNPLRAYKCAELQTNARYGYGTYEARMRIAKGSGLNTAMFTYSGPPLTPKHDEIDFEFLGKNVANVQLNYFTGARGGHETTPAIPADAATAFHTYAFVWAPGVIKWYVDGTLVRTATGADLPSTPGKFYLSLWSGSSTVDGWLGTFDASHLPATADVDWAAFTAAGERCRFPQSMTCAAP